MKFLYNFGIRCYGAAVRMVARRNPKAALMVRGQSETFPRLSSALEPGARYLWVHAASLGEFEQGRPFIEKVRAEMPEIRILLTFFSPSGYEVRKNYAGADIVCYLPFDTPDNARRFVGMVKPVAAVFVKYEFWNNYLQILRSRGVPTYLISGIFRERQSFFKWWGALFRNMLGCFTHLFVQDSESARLLDSIGVTNVTVAGDTRFDRVTDVMHSAHNVEGMDEFVKGSSFTLVVGSSWPADEDVYMPWLADNPEVRCIVAPHEFDDSRIETLRKRLGPGTVLMSEIKDNPAVAAGAHHVIINCYGLLSSIYRYGDAAYVGGGFGVGIHNVNEAAVYGIPVVFGPHHQKFKEALDLRQCGGGIAVRDRSSFARAMETLLDAEQRRRRGKCSADYIASHIGATEIAFESISSVLR